MWDQKELHFLTGLWIVFCFFSLTEQKAFDTLYFLITWTASTQFCSCCINLLIYILSLTVEMLCWLTVAFPAGCSSFAHHYNLLGAELAVCARTAKADWIFHFLHLCGCGWFICLQKGNSGSKLKKVPTQNLALTWFFFFSFLWGFFWHVIPCLQNLIRTGKGEKTVERRSWRGGIKEWDPYWKVNPGLLSSSNVLAVEFSLIPCQALSPWGFYPTNRSDKIPL